MTINKTEAAEALLEIERVAGRTRELRGYQIAGPIMMVWGVIWVVGYVAMGLTPGARWGWIWLVLDLVGLAATALMARRARMGSAAPPVAVGRRVVIPFLAITAFCFGLFAIFQSRSVNAYLAFPGLLAAVIYAAIGISGRTRFAWIGAALFVTTLLGFFLFPGWLTFWMAATGGGGLILAGLWLWRA